ncbi:MAG: HDOD domain-containing protein [Thermodesulfovibrionales bacterium]
MTDDTDKKPIDQLYEIPPVPMVADRIIRLLDDRKATISEMQDAIMVDQTLSARMLRMANSAFYSSGRKISTVSDAILTMGHCALRQLILATSSRDLYKNFGLIERKLWEHSIGVSVASALIAQEVAYPHIEEAAIAGLMHDIGKVIMDNANPEKFELLYKAVHDKRMPYHVLEGSFFQHGHAEVGGLLAVKWGFPTNLCAAIKRHHFFASYNDVSDLGTQDATLCCAVILGDALCVRLGIGFNGPMEDMPLKDKESREILGIGEEKVPELVESLKRAYVVEKLNYQAD